jgi:DNA-binding response OmpR family regulator
MEAASGNTVLIIEDEGDVVDLLALNLRKAGFATSTAPDALKRGLYHFQRRR